LESPEESPWAKVIAIVGGAGASGLVASQIVKALPQVPAEFGGAGAGLIAFLYGARVHPLVKWAGIGIIAGSLMPRIASWLGGLAPAGAPAGAPAVSEVDQAALAYSGG